jgi:hypothetical protein
VWIAVVGAGVRSSKLLPHTFRSVCRMQHGYKHDVHSEQVTRVLRFPVAQQLLDLTAGVARHGSDHFESPLAPFTRLHQAAQS